MLQQYERKQTDVQNCYREQIPSKQNDKYINAYQNISQDQQNLHLGN